MAMTEQTNAISSEDVLATFIDRQVIAQVLGCLIKDPKLLESYKFEASDFADDFYQLIYGVVNNLYAQNVEVIDAFAIDTVLKNHPAQHQMFIEKGGHDYVNGCLDLSEPKNFLMYYGLLKKFACMRKLQDKGLNVRPIIDITEPNIQKRDEAIRRFLHELSIDDILDKVEKNLVSDLRVVYAENKRHDEFRPGDNLEVVKEEWKQTPDFGLPFHGQKILTTITRGARMGTVSIYSGGTGAGKTRMGYGRMCGLSIPWYYEWEKDEWEYHDGFDNPCLIMQTELTRTENQSLVLSYVSGVDEGIIRTGKYDSKHQENVVDKAIEYIKQSPLYFDIITDFSITDILNTIKRYHRWYGCKYFFFDYLQLSQAIVAEMMAEARGMRSREDIVMLFAITELKNLVNELGIYLYTSTQLNNSYKDAGTFVDQSALRSAKSLADKIDVGDIMLPPTEAELKATAEYVRNGIIEKPNIVNHIYKCRGTKFSKLKLFQKADLGTCRVKDLFCTNINNVLVDVPVWDVEIGKKPGKRLDKKIENVIDQNSVNIDMADGDTVYGALNPESAAAGDPDGMFDPELNTDSHNALRDMGF